MTSAESSIAIGRTTLGSFVGWARNLHQRRNLFVLVAALVCLVPVFWAGDGRLVQTADYNNPLSPGRAISFVLSGWSPHVLGEASFRDVPLLFPYLAFWWLGDSFGLAVDTVQRLWLVALFALAFFSAWTFVRTVAPDDVARHWSTPVIAIAYVLNPFTLTTWAIGHQVAFLAYAAAPLWLTVFLRTIRRPASLRGGLPLAAVSLVFASAFNNPPIIATMIMAPTLLLTLFLVLRRTVPLREVAVRLASIAPWLLVVHAWWLVPLVWGVLSTGYAYGGSASSVLDWPNLAHRIDFLEFLRGTGYWGFHVTFRGAEYSTVPSHLAHPLVIAATLWLTCCAFLPLLLRRRPGVWSLMAVLLFLVSIFFAKGINPPLGNVNRWLYLNVPGSFLFRSAYEKFAGLAFLGILVALVCILAQTRGRLRNALLATTASAVLIAGWPLVTGSIIPTKSEAQIRADVRIPPYYEELADWTRHGSGNLLVVPQAPSGYVKTTWSYSGPDLIYHYSAMPVLAGVPEADPEDGPRYSAFLRAAQSFDRPGYLRRVGVTHVLVRRDMDWRFYSGTPHPRAVEAALNRAGFPLSASIGLFRIYRVPGSDGLVQNAETLLVPDGNSRRDLETLYFSSDSPLDDGIPHLGQGPGLQDVCVAELGQGQESCSLSTVADTEMVFTRAKVSGRLADDSLDLTVKPALRDQGLSVRASPTHFSIPIQGEAVALRIGNSLMPLVDEGLTPASVPIYRDTVADLLTAEGPNLLTPGLARYEQRSDTDKPVSMTDSGALQLRSEGDIASVVLPVRRFEPGTSFRISLGYNTVSGQPPALQVLENEGVQPTLDERSLPGGPGLQHYDTVFTPSPTSGSFRVILSAAAETNQVAVDRFSDLEVQALSAGSRVRVGESVSSSSSLEALSEESLLDPQPGRQKNLVNDPSFEQGLWSGAQEVGGNTPQILEAAHSTDAVSGEWSLELTSSGGDAGVLTGIKDFDPDAIYQVSFAYKHILGSPPAVGVWEHGSDRFVALERSLSTAPGWHRYHATLRPGPAAKEWSLFLYSFPNLEGTTVNRYDDVSVTSVPLPGRFLLFGPRQPDMDAASITSDRTAPSSYEGAIRGLDGMTWLLLRQAYDPAWHLQLEAADGSSDPQVLRHQSADGFANAWLIKGAGDLRFQLTYGAPFRRWGGALVTLLGLVAAALFPIVRSINGSRKRPQHSSRRGP